MGFRTAGEMMDTLTNEQYLEHSLFYEIEPDPMSKITYQIAKVGTMLLNVQVKGNPFKIEDVLIDYWKAPQKSTDIKAMLLGVNKSKPVTDAPLEKKPYALEGKVKERRSLPKRLRKKGK